MSAAALATTLVGLWLVAVTTFVLPARDPAHVVLWRGVALGGFAFAAVTLPGAQWVSRRSWSSAGVALLALVALGWGVWLLTATARSGEGYLLVMGVVFATHGGLALAEYGVGFRHPRRAPAA